MGDEDQQRQSHAARKFYASDVLGTEETGAQAGQRDGTASMSTPAAAAVTAKQGMPPSRPFEAIRKLVGEQLRSSDAVFTSPFGDRAIVYTDHTASSRALPSIEGFIQNEVLPFYANTHTTTSATGLQTTRFREEARDIIRNATNASEHDAVIFCGSGVTAAMNKLVHALGVRERVLQDQRVTVIHGPYEHHSNILPWRETGATVLSVREQPQDGSIDTNHLRQLLASPRVASSDLIVGTFAAMSNVTGIASDVDAITVLLHSHNALAIWDYATAAAYRPIDMNPVRTEHNKALVAPDAIVFSPHKLVGGVNTPGVLVAKRKLFAGRPPSIPGGGSVFYVTATSHRYLQDVEAREEAGTPDIVGAIRAGLALKLKLEAGADTIWQHERELAARALARLSKHPNLHILGNSSAPRAAILSFMIFHPETGRYLHHNFVCCLLNDVFGIQARGGCACAGPYAQRCMGMTQTTAAKIEALLVEDARLDRNHLRRKEEHGAAEMLRPGFVRINLPWFMGEEEAGAILSAVEFIATHGWKLLPLYNMHLDTGEWRHMQHTLQQQRRWLNALSFRRLATGHPLPQPPVAGRGRMDIDAMIADAHAAVAAAKRHSHVTPTAHASLMSDDAEALRWFVYPAEAAYALTAAAAKDADVPPPVRSPFVVGRAVSADKQTQAMSRQQCADGRDERGKGAKGKTVTGATDHTATGADNNDITPGVNGQPLEEVLQSLERVDAAKAAQVRQVLREAMAQEDDSHANATATTTAAIATLTAGDADSRRGGRDGDTKAADSAPRNASETIDAVGTDEQAHHTSGDSGVETSVQHHDGDGGGDKCLGPHAKSDMSSGEKTTTTTTTTKKKRREGVRFFCPPKNIMNPTFKALKQFDMLRDGDRVLVCVSGGKDSLTLLHVMRQAQYVFRSQGINFELGAATVDPGTEAYNPQPLQAYMRALDVPYFYEAQCIIDAASNVDNLASICSFCSRMKRGRLYACARREGYNVLMFGQHLDDLAESFMMSLFHNGYLRTMKAHYTVQEGDLRMARPFAFVRERDIRAFAERPDVALPIINENCPACFEAPTERHRVKQLLASQELIFPRLFGSIQAALMPLMSKNRTGMEARKVEAQKEQAKPERASKQGKKGKSPVATGDASKQT